MYLATVLREMPNCWLIRRLLTPEVWSLNIRFIFRMSICLFAMVLFHKKKTFGTLQTDQVQKWLTFVRRGWLTFTG